ncbi:TetR/AcrR family transcriptional regulator [Millisia brevis]|uniref:TetR/AcrR family transcriptional regulator n=1 Tax=Millisia brevis TaxID=264148 RepID=UPI00082A9675|nr:TetR family transcriptional regulator [Millisia brevis]
MTDTGARPRRRYAPRMSPENRRVQLLDVALDLVARDGLHQLTMESVAAAAGIGKPVVYTVFSTRGDLVGALLERESERATAQVLAALPTDLDGTRAATSFEQTVTTFMDAVLADPTRWRLILTPPENAPGDYRTHLRDSRRAILRRAEELARIGISREPGLACLDANLMANTMVSFAEMLGRLAAADPVTYNRERLLRHASQVAGALSTPPRISAGPGHSDGK